MGRLIAALVGAGLLCSSLIAYADRLHLANGDQLTGEVIKMEGNVLTFKTGYAGKIQIKWSEVTGITTDSPLRLILKDDSDLRATLLPGEPGQAALRVADSEDIAQMDLKRIKFLNPSPELTPDGIKVSGRINVGAAMARGNSDTDKIHADAEVVARTREDRVTLGAAARRAKDRQRETESNAKVYGKYDHFLSKHWYAYANTQFERDRFKDIKLRSAYGVGSGYQVYESKPLNLFVEGGLTYVNTDYFTRTDEEYPSLRWALKFDKLLFATRSQIFHEHELLVSLKDANDTLLRTRSGLRFPLTKRLNASAQFNVDWDRSPAPGKAPTDRSLLFNMGYAW